MDMEKDIQRRPLQDLLRALPAERPSDDLNDRIMQAVRLAKDRQDKRAERNGLLWTIALSTFVLGAGAGALYFFIDWDSFGAGMAGAFGVARSVLPFAGIALLLLIGDSLLRRRKGLTRSV